MRRAGGELFSLVELGLILDTRVGKGDIPKANFGCSMVLLAVRLIAPPGVVQLIVAGPEGGLETSAFYGA